MFRMKESFLNFSGGRAHGGGERKTSISRHDFNFLLKSEANNHKRQKAPSDIFVKIIRIICLCFKISLSQMQKHNFCFAQNNKKKSTQSNFSACRSWKCELLSVRVKKNFSASCTKELLFILWKRNSNEM